VSDRPLDFTPGSALSYSNTGYFLLGLIIERATGRSFGTFVRDEIAAPLGLADTALCDAARKTGRTVRGYEVSDGALVPGRLYLLPDLVGDGGVCSTVTDLARLPGALLDGDVLSPAALARMTTPTEIADGVRLDYGLGVRLGVLDGHRVWGHTGGMGSYWSVLAHYPDDDLTLVVLVNTDGAAEDALTIEGDVARVVLGLGEPALEDLPLSPPERRRFIGLYEDGSESVRIGEAGGRLERTVEGRGSRRLLHQGDGVFGWPEYPMDRFVFHVVNGRARGVSEYYNGLFATYRRAVDPI
jgi:CubicO group peptidase (beta-lactamase class C family)